MIKKLLMLASIACCTCTTLATEVNLKSSKPDTEIKLEGVFVFESGYINQNHLVMFEKNVSDNKKNLTFYTEAAIAATIAQSFNDIIAGAKIVLLPTTRPKTSTSYNGSHIFVITEYGKVEVGSPYDAGANMRITANQINAGSGGWYKYALLDGQYMRYRGAKPNFDTGPTFYIESYSNNFDQINDKTEAARKVSYYTPKIKGFQFGISYTPDSANDGGNRDINNLTFTNSARTGISKSLTGISIVDLQDGTTVVLNQNIKDSVSAGFSYDHDFNNDLALKLAVTAEYGKPARKVMHRTTVPIHNIANSTVLATYKLADLKAYNLGAILSYGNFSCAASYGNLGKSLTTPEYYKVGRNTYYYDGSIAYDQGPIKTSISYFKSSRYKNTIDTISLGTQYKVMPGLLPYAEITHFRAKGKPVFHPEAPHKKTKGTVGIIGAKFKF